jgi:hypothetical protein
LRQASLKILKEFVDRFVKAPSDRRSATFEGDVTDVSCALRIRIAPRHSLFTTHQHAAAAAREKTTHDQRLQH